MRSAWACQIRPVQVHLLRNGEKPTGNCHFNVQVSSVRCCVAEGLSAFLAKAIHDSLKTCKEATSHHSTMLMQSNG